MADNAVRTILAVETASEQCVVALQSGVITRVRRESDRQQHSRRLLEMVDLLLQEADLSPSALDLLVWSSGPGSFTGLRIAASFCQALSWAHAVPVLAVSTLEAMAQAVVVSSGLSGEHVIATALDARMGDIYFGLYRATSASVIRLIPDQIIPANADSVLQVAGLESSQFVMVGDGWKLPSLACIKGQCLTAQDTLPHALICLANSKPETEWCLNPADIAPKYLRGSMQWKKREPIGGVAG